MHARRTNTRAKTGTTQRTSDNPDSIRIVWIHNDEYSSYDLIVNTSGWVPPNIQLRDTEVFELCDPSGTGPRVYLQGSTKIEEGRQNLQASVHRNVAMKAPFCDIIKERGKVFMKLLLNPSRSSLPPDIFLSHVELGFREQFVSRSDQWLVAQYLQEQALSSEGRTTYDGYVFQTCRMLNSLGESVRNGIVSADTKFTFTSASCVAVWLFQLSREMWEFTSGGDLYLDRAIDDLMGDILSRWKLNKVHHILYVVLFAHTSNAEDADFVDVVLVARDERDYEKVQSTIREACFRLARVLSGGASIQDIKGGSLLSHAKNGNMLQAINLALNLFDDHMRNRNLNHTGHMLVVFTAGQGIVHASYALKQITAQRLSELGITCDMLCVRRPSAHVAPLFEYSGMDEALRANARYRIEPDKLYYESPKFISVHYYSRDHRPGKSGLHLYTFQEWLTIEKEEESFIPSSVIPHRPSGIYVAEPDKVGGETLVSMFDKESADSQAILCDILEPEVRQAKPVSNHSKQLNHFLRSKVWGHGKKIVPFGRVASRAGVNLHYPSPSGTSPAISSCTRESPVGFRIGSGFTPPSRSSQLAFFHANCYHEDAEAGEEASQQDVLDFITAADVRLGTMTVVLSILSPNCRWNKSEIDKNFQEFSTQFMKSGSSETLTFFQFAKYLPHDDPQSIKIRFQNNSWTLEKPTTVSFNPLRKFFLYETSDDFSKQLNVLPPTVQLFDIHPVESSVFHFHPVNPYVPLKEFSQEEYDAQWVHAIPDDVDEDTIWRFLILRQLIPLTTPQGLLEVDKYVYSNHQVLMTDDSDNMIQEMILQRLIQSYQYVGTYQREKSTHDLSIGYQYHIITKQENSIVVTRYEHRGTYLVADDLKFHTSSFASWNHRSLMWDRRKVTFQTSTSMSKHHKWVDVDNWILSFYLGESSSTIPYQHPSFRTRTLAFAILPGRSTVFAEPKGWHDSLDSFFNSQFSSKFQVTHDASNVWGHDYTSEFDFTTAAAAVTKEIGICLRVAPYPSRKKTADGRILQTNDRIAWFHISISSEYNHNCWIFFKVYWLHCSGQHIAEWVNAMKLRARQCGFQIVQIPFSELNSEIDPFQRMVLLPLNPFHPMYGLNDYPTAALQQWAPKVMRRSLILLLTEKNAYYPETMKVSGAVRLLHHTGSIMVQFFDDQVAFYINYFHKNAGIDVKGLYQEFMQMIHKSIQAVDMYASILHPVWNALPESPSGMKSTEFKFVPTYKARQTIVFMNPMFLSHFLGEYLLVNCCSGDDGAHEADNHVIPGSIKLHQSTLFAKSRRTQLPRSSLASPQHFYRFLSEHGISRKNESALIIFYDEEGGGAASVAWWMATSYGLVNCYIMDGGFNQWVYWGCPLPETNVAFHKTQDQDMVPLEAWTFGKNPCVLNLDKSPLTSSIVVVNDFLHMPGTIHRIATDTLRRSGNILTSNRDIVSILKGTQNIKLEDSVACSYDLSASCFVVALCLHTHCSVPQLYSE